MFFFLVFHFYPPEKQKEKESASKKFPSNINLHLLNFLLMYEFGGNDFLSRNFQRTFSGWMGTRMCVGVCIGGWGQGRYTLIMLLIVLIFIMFYFEKYFIKKI